MIQFPQAERSRIAMRWLPTILLALIFCAAPLWLWNVPLRSFFLESDDFGYLGQSRTSSAIWRHLFTPHNGHVAPLFLLETHALAWLAGSLERLPSVLSWASYATLVLAIAATGHVAARETGRAALGLAAMAALGLSSVLGPTLLWYAATQALASGTMIMVMLAALQHWRSRDSWWSLSLGLIASIAAPLFWTAGYAAGLVAMAYLWGDGRRASRGVAILFPVVSVVVALCIWRLAGGGFALASHFATRSLVNVLPLDVVVVRSAQAICEALVLNNLGLDAATTGVQGLCFIALLAGIWAWSRRGSHPPGLSSWPRVNPLEAAGAVLVAASFGMIFAGRAGESSFDGLRAMGWYDAMAQLGAALFAIGWWSGPIEWPPHSVEPPRRNELLAVMLFAMLMLAVQAPRIDRVIYEYDGSAAPFGPSAPIRAIPRTAADLAAQAKTQRRALAALDRLEQSARETGMTRSTIREALGRVSIPGMPERSPDFNALDLLNLPDREIHSASSPGS